MFKKVLVANRGEIAVRIIRACRELDLPVAAVYSEEDRNALHVEMADESYCIGPAAAQSSYLNIPAILTAACAAQADAIHPGYGFLAENADFAEACRSCGIAFIGPDPQAIRRMGDKSQARATMQDAGVPVVPGSGHLLKDAEEAVEQAAAIGYPVILKATAGGGGKGMRIAAAEEELRQAYRQAQREAMGAFGNPGVYIEKYLRHPRHIEFQIMADCHGNIVHLNERDCSIQRRHQKLLEEAPSPALSDLVRERMGAAAVAAGKAVNYVGAGTVEFLLDADERFYFMEMNTRIQVEHPVTEMVTGIDLVKEQIRVAAGYPLSFSQPDIAIRGCAIECRINAEDPDRRFARSPGTVVSCRVPGGFGVRVDTSVYPGSEISPYYDSMVAKLIVWGKDRNEAVQRMKRSLKEYRVKGISTTIPFHEKIMRHASFVQGDYHTGFLHEHFDSVPPAGD